MSLVYDHDGIKLYQGDCVELMDSIPEESVSLILTDPPYMISKEIKISRGRNKMKFKGSDIDYNFGEWDKFESLNDYLEFTMQWATMCAKILRKGGMFCSYYDKDKINFLSKFLQDNKFKLKRYFADIKSNPVPQARKVGWMSGWEMLGMWQKEGGELTYNYELGQQADYYIRPIVGNSTNETRYHPTQKPVQLIKLFVNYWTKEGDTVLDPFCGSGTTLIACKELNRNAIGIEQDYRYCEIVKKRLVQLELFNKENKYE
jgi:DNA modification methylase